MPPTKQYHELQKHTSRNQHRAILLLLLSRCFRWRREVVFDMIRDYVKISEQDLLLAEDFFENDKHFNEWLINVVRYYRGQNIQIKTKIVQKYFNNYKKTMDFILNSIKTGGKGAEVKAEKQALKEATLEGVVKPSLEPSLEPNIKTVIDNSKGKIDFSEFWNIYPRKEKKKDAQLKWDKLPLETQKKILQTLPKFLQGKETKYVPMPVTYFNAQRWDDELTPVSTELERPNEEDFPDWFAYDTALKAYSKQESDKFVSQL